MICAVMLWVGLGLGLGLWLSAHPSFVYILQVMTSYQENNQNVRPQSEK